MKVLFTILFAVVAFALAGLFLGKYSDGSTQTMFPVEELDYILPKIIRAGYRVAIVG